MYDDKPVRYDPETVKDSWTMEDVLELCEIDERYDETGQGFKIYSFLNSENTPSCHIYHDHWYDFSAGRGGDQIAFVMAYNGWSFGKALRVLATGIDDPDNFARPKLERKPPPEPIDFTHRVVKDSNLNYGGWLSEAIYRKWGITFSAARSANWRRASGDALWIPHHNEEGIWGVRVRDLVNSRFDKKSITGSQFKVLYHPRWACRLLEPESTWVICEGEPDAVRVNQHLLSSGQPARVRGLPSGALTLREEWFDSMAGQVVVLADAGTTGEESARRIREMCTSADRVTVALPPEGSEDASEALQNGHQISLGGGPIWV